MSAPDLLQGSITLPSKKTVTLEMPAAHWQSLKWLTEIHEGDVVAEIAELLADSNRTTETDSEIVIWYIQIWFAAIHGEVAGDGESE